MTFFRKILFWMHLAAGILIGSILFVMAFTGSLMAFGPQMTDFVERHVSHVIVPVQDNFSKPTLISLMATAAAAMPGKNLSGITIQSDPKAAAIVSFGKNGGSLFVNPYTGEILGKGSAFHEWMQKVEDFHRRLGAGENGRKITGTVVVIFFFMVLSGIYLWWPKNWNGPSLKVITLFNFNLRDRLKDFNLHNVIGFWCLPMMLVTALTGTIMAHTWANNLLFRLAGSEPPAAEGKGRFDKHDKKHAHEKSDSGKMNPASIDLDEISAEAQKRIPDWVSVNLRLPQRPGAPLVVWIQEPKGKYSNPNPRSQLTFDSETGEVTKWEPFSEASSGKKLRVWVKYLHTGEWSVIGQTIAFVSAWGVLFMIYTGFAMAWRRFNNIFASGLRPTGDKVRSK